MNLRSLLLLLSVGVCTACSAESTQANDPKQPLITGEPSDEDASKATFRFVPDQVVATRTPFHATCLEKNAAFTDDDLFTIQPVRTSAPASKLKSIAIEFNRTVPKNTKIDLVLGGPVNGATFENAENAHAADEKTGLGLVAFLADGTTSKPLSKATVTIVDVPTKDGDPSTAHVVLEFQDGDVLDETFTGALKSYDGACGGG